MDIRSTPRSVSVQVRGSGYSSSPPPLSRPVAAERQCRRGARSGGSPDRQGDLASGGRELGPSATGSASAAMDRRGLGNQSRNAGRGEHPHPFLDHELPAWPPCRFAPSSSIRSRRQSDVDSGGGIRRKGRSARGGDCSKAAARSRDRPDGRAGRAAYGRNRIEGGQYVRRHHRGGGRFRWWARRDRSRSEIARYGRKAQRSPMF